MGSQGVFETSEFRHTPCICDPEIGCDLPFYHNYFSTPTKLVTLQGSVDFKIPGVYMPGCWHSEREAKAKRASVSSAFQMPTDSSGQETRAWAQLQGSLSMAATSQPLPRKELRWGGC